MSAMFAFASGALFYAFLTHDEPNADGAWRFVKLVVAVAAAVACTISYYVPSAS